MGNILVIDDDEQVLDVVSEMLRMDGHEVATAENGGEALTKFNQAEYDLVITDLIMPDMEGLETITELRAAKESIPIIAMSGGGRVGPMDYLETARFIGATETLAKPFTRNELVAAVQRLMPEAGSGSHSGVIS